MGLLDQRLNGRRRAAGTGLGATILAGVALALTVKAVRSYDARQRAAGKPGILPASGAFLQKITAAGSGAVAGLAENLVAAKAQRETAEPKVRRGFGPSFDAGSTPAGTG